MAGASSVCDRPRKRYSDVSATFAENVPGIIEFSLAMAGIVAPSITAPSKHPKPNKDPFFLDRTIENFPFSNASHL
jgi:hypothetical protein